jgi:hypothetical protein
MREWLIATAIAVSVPADRPTSHSLLSGVKASSFAPPARTNAESCLAANKVMHADDAFAQVGSDVVHLNLRSGISSPEEVSCVVRVPQVDLQ